jgi:hypothetical protein
MTIETNYTKELYETLRNNKSLRSLYLPHSDVYYTMIAIEKNTGVALSCKQVEALMREMGWDK